MLKNLMEKLSNILSVVETFLEFCCLFLFSVPWVLTSALLVGYLKLEEVFTGKKTNSVKLEIAGFRVVVEQKGGE